MGAVHDSRRHRPRIPALVLGSATSTDGGRTPLFYPAVLVPSIALTVRRLHDGGFSGWLVLLGLIPSLGGLILLVLALLPPSPNGGRYDPVPAPGYGYPPGWR